MNTYTVAFPSVTHASKAKAAFERHGLNAKIIRTPKTLAAGCGYSVVTDADPAAITKILESSGLHYKAISQNKQ